jgi:hypothetical protein
MLKKRWQSATCQAWTGLEVTTVAAMIPVMVVPMLAPRVGKHVLEADETHSREGGEGGGGDGGGLHHDGDEHANGDVQVAVEADNLLKEHDAEEAGAEGDDGEESPAPSSVISHSSRVRPPLRRRLSRSFLILPAQTA